MTSPTPPVRPAVKAMIAGLLILPGPATAGPRHTKPTTVEVKAAPRRHTSAARGSASPAAARPALHADRFRRQVRARVSRMNDRAIDTLRRLIEATGDDDPDKPDLLFRLAEHYRDKKVDQMFRARELDEAIFRARSAARASMKRRQQALERAERRWLLAAAQTYVKVASKPAFAGYRRMDAVLFNLADLLGQAGRRDRARIFFRRLIRNYPQSPFIPDAYLSFAEFYFNAGKVEDALRLYDKVARHPDSPLYGYALYKQGWCWLNLRRPQRALERFVLVIRRGASGKDGRRQQARIVLVREARKDAVRAYSQVGSADKAWAFFSRIGGRHAPRMLGNLAALYHDQGKFLPAIQTYRKLMALRPRSDDLCAWQHSVLRATLPGKDKRQQLVEARRLAAIQATLVQRRARPSVLRSCRESAAGVLRELATLWHRECNVTKNMETCKLAGQLYQEYLARYPEQKDAYRLRFYLAELLFALERWRPAATAYSAVVAARPRRGKYLAEAAYAAVVALKNALDVRQTPSSADEVRRRHRAAAGRQEIRKPQPIPEGERELMAAFATYLRVVPRSPERVSILYREGRMLYSRNHHGEAIERFARLVTRYPRHDLAVYAANLLLDSLNILGRHAELERWALRLRRHPHLGQGALKGPLDEVLFGIRWNNAEAARRQGQYRRCGELFARLANDYQEHPRWPQMLHNAALCFEAAKLVGQAIAIRNTLIKLKPQHQLAQRALYTVAQNYHALAWYSRAADYYERFARGFPGETQAPEALQNAIVFRVGRGEHDKARADARLFAKSYGGRRRYAARAAAVSFSLGAIHEARGDAEAVAQHYKRYLRRWGSRGGRDLQVRAHVKIARALWDRACPIEGVNGACVRVRRERSRRQLARRSRRSQRSGQIRTHCGSEARMKLTVVRRRRGPLRAAQAHLGQALALHARLAAGGKSPRLPTTSETQRKQRLVELDRAAAQALFLRAEARYEDFLTVTFPTGLDLTSRDRRRTRRSRRILAAYLQTKSAKLEQARALYRQVIKRRAAHHAIAAAARIGQLFQTFADALFAAPIPTPRVPPVLARKPMDRREFIETYNDTYCAELERVAVPLERKAVQGLKACTRKAKALSWYNGWSKMCERELNQLRPGSSFMASEIRAGPRFVALRPARTGVITRIR